MVQFYFLCVLLNIVLGLILMYGVDLTGQETVMVIKETKKESEDSFSFDSAGEEATVDSKLSSSDGKTGDGLKEFSGLNNKTLRFVLGVLAVVVSLLKIISVYNGGIPVIGDLIPAAACFMGGAAVLVEYFQVSSVMDIPDGVSRLFIGFRKYIGVLCIVAGLIHFLLPQVTFL